MASAQAFARKVRLFRDASLSPQALSHNLATKSRTIRDDLIAKGQAPNSYRTYVDGVEGASEDTVRPDGAIIYQFNNLGRAAVAALTWIVIHSPFDSGDFKAAWMVAVDGKPWVGDLLDIPARSEVMIVNPLPYSRKIETGHMKLKSGTGPYVIQRSIPELKKSFPRLTFNQLYLDIPSGLVTIPAKFGPVPYVLKGHQRSSAKRWASHLKRAGTRTIATNRRDLRAGELLTYPALVIADKI